jgi:hypothetical protein
MNFFWQHKRITSGRTDDVSQTRLPLQHSNIMNDSQEAFRRFTRQLRVGKGNGRFPGGGGGLFAGSGFLIALLAGGFALNAALFNGERLPSFWS